MAAIPVTLFEHQFRSYADISLYPADATRRDRVLASLERINERAGQEILHLGRKGLRANALVGVVRAGDFIFEILPKIDCPSLQNPGNSTTGSGGLPSHSPQVSASHNLMAMLSYAYNLRLLEQEITGLWALPSPWLEVLTRLFAAGLRREIVSGLSQEYVAREETLSVLRGRWDIQRQLRQPGRDQAAFDVIYDDLSPDYPLNQVFRFVVEQLQGITRDPTSLALLADLSTWFRPVALLPQVTSEFLDSISFNRLNERFQPAFNLARMFLSGSAIQLAAGSQAACAFVFDMNMLFERFVAGFLARYRGEILPAQWQEISILPQSAGAAWYLAHSGGKNLFRMRPDLLFMARERPAPLLVVDTKYKRIAPDNRKTGASPEDVYQMLAYAVRLQCARGLLLYPQVAGSAIRKRFKIDSAGLRLSVATLNLNAPLEHPGALIAEMRDILTGAI